MKDELLIHEAFKAGDLGTLKEILGPTFPNCEGHEAFSPYLEYAIYHSPLTFIETLVDLGSDPNYEEHGGFPSLIAALTSEREDLHQLLELLLAAGADVNQRGHNDYTPLHYAASLNDPVALKILIDHGAYLTARTRIDDLETPLELAEDLNHSEAVKVLKKARYQARMNRPSAPEAATTATIAELLAEIDAAFDWRPPPEEGKIALRKDAVWRFFRGKRWQEITMDSILADREIDWSSFILSLTREGRIYYLPALLKMSLELPSPIGNSDPLVYILVSDPKPIASALTPAEMRGVVHVLDFLAADYRRRGFTVNLAQEALEIFGLSEGPAVAEKVL